MDAANHEIFFEIFSFHANYNFLRFLWNSKNEFGIILIVTQMYTLICDGTFVYRKIVFITWNDSIERKIDLFSLNV